MSIKQTEFTRNYAMSPEQVECVEHDLVHIFREQHGYDVGAVWVSPRSEYANMMRTREAGYFPEVTSLDESYDFSQDIFLLVDGRKEDPKVLHATTIMSYKETDDPLSTGFYTIDSLIKLGNFSKQDFLDYYGEIGIDVRTCLAVETNFKIHPKARRIFPFMNSADVAHLLVYREVFKRGARVGSTAVFATMNEKQSLSLDRLGIDIQSLLGRFAEEFSTEEGEQGVKSTPVAILGSALTASVFDSIEYDIPEVKLII